MGPTAGERMENNASKWVLFQQFRDKLHREAKKAAVSRNLSLDDAGLEDYDLRDSQNQSQNNSQSISRQLDAMGDININIEDDEEKKEEKEQAENEENEEPNVVHAQAGRVSVSISNRRRMEEEEVEMEDAIENEK